MSTRGKAAKPRTTRGRKKAKAAPRRAPTLKARMDELVDDMVAKGIRLPEAQAQLERAFLQRILARCDGNQTRAAEALEVHRNTLRRKLQEHGLN